MSRIILSIIIIITWSCENNSLENKQFNSTEMADTIVINNFFSEGELYLITKGANDQIYEFKIFNDTVYKKLFIPGYNMRTLGADIFTYQCSSCHNYYPQIKKEFARVKDLDPEKIIKILNDKNHINIFHFKNEKFNTHEVEAIINYIKGSNDKIKI